MSSSENSKGFISRITQLDSLFLDSEGYSLIKSQLLSVVKYIGQNFVTKLEPEIDTLLGYIILHHTVEKARSSVGQQLLQIKYCDSIAPQKLKRYVLVLLFGKWLKLRAGDVMYTLTRNSGVKDKVNRIADALEVVYRISEFANSLVFLYHGVYPSILQRIFGLIQVSSAPGKARRISYNYFTRELLWHGFAELLAFVLPLINIQYFHQFVRKLLPSSSDDKDSDDDETAIKFGSETTCIVCNNLPIIPHSFGCQHIGCYYCIHSTYAIDPGFSCPLCGHQIENKVQIVPAYVS